MRVVAVSSSRWSGYSSSLGSLATAFSDLGHHVLYVDPPVSPLSLVRQPERLGDLLGAARESPRPGLEVWRPRVVPGQNSAVGQRVNTAILRRGIGRLLGTPDLSVITSLEARGLAPSLPGRRIYCSIDSFEDLPGTNTDVIRERERRMAEVVDLVVACSLPLQRQWRSRGTEALYVPHGCDPVFLGSAPAAPPSELAAAPRPRVGYVGSMNFRIDTGLLEAARRAVPEGSLVMIGGQWGAAGPRADPAVRSLCRHANVVSIGHRPVEDLPRWLAALDVGLVPYRAESAFNRKSYPLKILQYLAAGLPVVSTPNGATEELAAEVATAVDAAQFEIAVGRAVREDTAERRAARRAAAARRPWTAVAEEIIAGAGIRE
jgi:teichuronic acid biosynthesis glycosyltransferase TuaH